MLKDEEYRQLGPGSPVARLNPIPSRFTHAWDHWLLPLILLSMLTKPLEGRVLSSCLKKISNAVPTGPLAVPLVVMCVATVLTLLLTGCTCQQPSRTPASENESTPTTVIVWDVYKGDRKVLVVRNEPGPITSTAMLPPGAEITQHPFLSAYALDPMEENNLRIILEKSHSFDEFISLLKASGYRLKKPQ